MRQTRAEKAGIQAGEALVEMIHLMYQNNTALSFMDGLLNVLQKEKDKRHAKWIKNIAKGFRTVRR